MSDNIQKGKDFVNKSLEKNKEKYDYSLVEYKDTKTKVAIHGISLDDNINKENIYNLDDEINENKEIINDSNCYYDEDINKKKIIRTVKESKTIIIKKKDKKEITKVVKKQKL